MTELDTGKPEEGLHKLKRVWVQKSYLERHCLELLGGLDEALEATYRAATPRSAGRTYRFCPPEGSRKEPAAMGNPGGGSGRGSEERRLEAALFEKFGRGTGRPAAPLWARLVGYQIPLFDARERKGWGHIDLLGLDEGGAPVIVELKRSGSKDTPLHALLEAASYAVALRKDWAAVRSELSSLGIASADSPAKWTLVLLAPGGYWNSWSPGTPTGLTLSPAARSAYRELCGAFAERGMPVFVGQVDGLRDWSGAAELDSERLTVKEVERAWFSDGTT